MGRKSNKQLEKEKLEQLTEEKQGLTEEQLTEEKQWLTEEQLREKLEKEIVARYEEKYKYEIDHCKAEINDLKTNLNEEAAKIAQEIVATHADKNNNAAKINLYKKIDRLTDEKLIQYIIDCGVDFETANKYLDDLDADTICYREVDHNKVKVKVAVSENVWNRINRKMAAKK